MPRTTHPHKDGPGASAPSPPGYFAEQALLGALLSEPHRLPDITGIEPDAFTTAVHAAVFAAVQALPAPAPVETADHAAAVAALRARPATRPGEHAEHIAWLGKVLTAARERARGLTAAHLHALISACPTPRHTPAYARIIAAEHARRRLHKAAQRLTHTARDTSLPHPVPSTLAEADALSSVVDGIAAAFPPHSGSPPRTPTPPHDALPGGEQAAQEERLLLATATARPAEIEQMRWLTGEDFTLPLHAGLWQCLTTLVHRRAPVDPVTVLWQAQQHGALGNTPDAREVLGFLAKPDVSAPYLAERILHRSVLATAHHVGRRIEAFTDDPANSPYQLVVGSRRALAELTAIRTRWQQATSPATGPPPRTTPPARRTGPAPTTAAPAGRLTR
ncbi:DnaB-like helicase N-terminal domain-containing protein [Streptomyces sp. NPDC038707]|uniref:DnaB-like helicase N-terminal domain-containing protein n=1 Tax=Streptomyces sp. NPDC038707 TaxID=3154329 RepID=UPI0034102036